jgi:hypothetical protein
MIAKYDICAAAAANPTAFFIARTNAGSHWPEPALGIVR